MAKECESSLLPYLKSPDVVRAIGKRYFVKINKLNLELDKDLKAKKERVMAIDAKIDRLEPRVGKVLSAAQFEEYVSLQRQLLGVFKEQPNTIRARINKEFADMLTDCKILYAPSNFNKFITAPFTEDLKETKESYPGVYFVMSYILLFIVLCTTMFAFRPESEEVMPEELEMLPEKF